MLFSILIVLASLTTLIVVLSMNKEVDKISESETISATETELFNNNALNLSSAILPGKSLFNTKEIEISVTASIDVYLRVAISFDYSYTGNNLSKRFDADISEQLDQICSLLPLTCSNNYKFTYFEDGFYYLTDEDENLISLFELTDYFDSLNNKYVFDLFNFNTFVFDNSLSIFESDVYNYYNYNLNIQVQTLEDDNLDILDNESNKSFSKLSDCFKNEYVKYNEELIVHYDNTLGYYVELGQYPYNFATEALRAKKIKWLMLNYNPNTESEITLYSEHILTTMAFNASIYTPCESGNYVTRNSLTHAYSNDYYGSDVRAYLKSEDFLSTYSISVEDAIYKAIESQNILDIFNNSNDCFSGAYNANSNIDTLTDYNANFASENDKFALLNYNDISMMNYRTYRTPISNSSSVPINYNGTDYNYENLLLELTNFFVKNQSLILQDEFNQAIYDNYFSTVYEGYDSRYEYDIQDEYWSAYISEKLIGITDENFIKAYYFINGYIYISDESNVAYGADDNAYFLLKWNGSLKLLNKMQKFLKLFTDDKISILVASPFNFKNYYGVEKIGCIWYWGTLSPSSLYSDNIVSVYHDGNVNYEGTVMETLGLRPAFKLTLSHN